MSYDFDVQRTTYVTMACKTRMMEASNDQEKRKKNRKEEEKKRAYSQCVNGFRVLTRKINERKDIHHRVRVYALCGNPP